MIELFFACLYALFLLYLWNRESKKPIVDNSDPRVANGQMMMTTKVQ